MTLLRNELALLSRYGLVGLASNGVLYVLFLLLLRLGVLPTVAAGLCYVLGVGLSYVLNRRWTFSSRENHTLALAKYVAAYGTGFVSALGTIYILTLWLPPELAQIINIGTTALVIYGSLRILRFGKRRADHAH